VESRPSAASHDADEPRAEDPDTSTGPATAPSVVLPPPASSETPGPTPPTPGPSSPPPPTPPEPQPERSGPGAAHMPVFGEPDASRRGRTDP
jgi:hypothetical protein